MNGQDSCLPYTIVQLVTGCSSSLLTSWEQSAKGLQQWWWGNTHQGICLLGTHLEPAYLYLQILHFVACLLYFPRIPCSCSVHKGTCLRWETAWFTCIHSPAQPPWEGVSGHTKAIQAAWKHLPPQ